MKKYVVLIMAVVLIMTLAGCDSWLSGSYSSVKVHEEYYDGQSKENLEAGDSEELQKVLTEQISNGTEKSVIYISDIAAERLESVMELVIRRVMTQDPIGAFAVEKIDYEIGTSTGRTAIAVDIAYNRSRSEILRIKNTSDMEEAMAVVSDALENCYPGVVVLVENYEDIDITQKVQDYIDAHPDTCMEMPQVSESVYPQAGKVRVIELTFTYQTSRDVLRSMQTYVQPVFRAADLNVSGEEEDSVKFSRMYAFLMERNDYQIETSITPAYSLLRHGVGDSKAFATVYAAMCRGAGLECQVIAGTRSGDPWVWNLICEDGVYYHVDLIQSSHAGKMLRLSQDDMDGYVWDYSSYPEAVPQEKSTAKPLKSGNSDNDKTSAEEAMPTEPVPEETVPESTVPDVTIPETVAPEE